MKRRYYVVPRTKSASGNEELWERVPGTNNLQCLATAATSGWFRLLARYLNDNGYIR